MSKTKIPWCDLTINPIIGCSKCSPGCLNCYAERFAARLAKNPDTAERYSRVITDGKWNGKIDVDFYCFSTLPRAVRKRIFVGSMGDMFHESVDQEAIDMLFRQFRISPRHTFLLLTKRPERMKAMLSRIGEPNVWLGVTVCNQDEADEKIPILLSTPAAKRFVSIEPMLGQINLQKAYPDEYHHCEECGWHGPEVECPYVCSMCDRDDFPGWDGDGDTCKNGHNGYGHRSCPRCGNNGGGVFSIHDVHELHEGDFDFPGLDWVIVGGETGPGARPMHPEWSRAIRDQCRAVSVPFFFKQMSGKAPIPDDLMIREVPE